MKEMYEKVIQPFKGEKIFVVNEAYSTHQCWIEGCLEASYDVLELIDPSFKRGKPKKSKPKIFPERVIREVELPEQMPDRLMFEVIKLKGFGPTILVYGGIEDGDFARFKNFYNTLDEPPKNITFNSPGGSVYEALDLGRFIRSKDMKSVMLPGNYCFSACPYMFAAGRKRVAFQDSALGMHQHYYDESIILPTFLAVENIQIGQGQTMLYLIEMDISPGVMLYSLNTPPDEIYVLVKEELLETDLATEFLDR